MKTRLLPLLVVLAVIFLTGCPPVNNTGLGSCFLGNSGTGCIGTPNIGPGNFPLSGGFSLYTLYRLQTADEDFRADNILAVSGQAQMAGAGGQLYGTAQAFGPEPSGPANVAPPATPNAGTGFIDVPDGVVPAQWLINWGSSAQSQWAGYLQTHFGPLNDESGQQWPNFCNGAAQYFNISVGQTTAYRCILNTCGCKVETATAFSPSSYSQPNAQQAGNLVWTTVQIPYNFSPGFVQGHVAVEVFDASGNMASCMSISTCDPLTVTSGNSFKFPPKLLAWSDDNRPGDYYAQIFTLVNGQWIDFDSFGYTITQGGFPVFRSRSRSLGTHYWSFVRDEGNIWPYDYQYEAIGFYTYDQGYQTYGGYSLELFRDSCCSGGGNGAWLLTDSVTEHTNAENAGWIPDSYLGFIMPTQNSSCNANSCFTPDIPLYRVWIQAGNQADFNYTTSYSDYQYLIQHLGWHDQGIQGYVPTGP